MSLSLSAKLPLVICSQIINIIRDPVLLGFDIGCTFQTTLQNSSLGEAFDACKSRVCVNAFHGYSHSYTCQVRNHPNVIEDMGIEDLERLECVFSASNQLASVTHYSSAFCRRLLIHVFFWQWDEEKYTNLGAFLYNNYVQALDIIETKKHIVEESMGALKLSYDDLKMLEKEEQEYFDTLQDESPWDLHAIMYTEALQELRTSR